MVINHQVLIGTSALSLFLLVGGQAANACSGGACGPVSTASEQSNTTTNSNSPTAVSNTTSNPVGYATGVSNNTQLVFNEHTRSTFEGVVNIPGGTSIKGAVSCGNNSASIVAFPQMTGDNRWNFAGGVNLSFVKNTVDCRGQQEIVECAQLFAMNSTGTYYDKRCGKFGFRRPTVTASEPREFRISPAPATSPAAIPVETPTPAASRQPVRGLW